MAVSMHDVARRAGVSQRTVSNVINRSAPVASETRARVEKAIVALGYRPNLAARRLRSSNTGTITLALPGFSERHFADLAEAVIRQARKRDIDVLVETTGGVQERELAILSGTEGILTDGVIMSAISIGSQHETVRRACYPLVLVGDYEYAGPVDHISIPNREATHAAVLHLAEQGCRRIALAGNSLAQNESLVLRRQGYLTALADAGLPSDARLIYSSEWTHESGRVLADRLAQLPRGQVDAVFAMNDTLALGILDGLLRAGVRIPHDIAVAGFDDTLEAQHSLPQLTSIDPSSDEVAERALTMVAEQLADTNHEREPRREHVPFTLKIRESSQRRPGLPPIQHD